MQHGETKITIAEAARRLKLNRSTLGRQAGKGDIRCHDGLVYFSEVLEDRAAKIDLTRSKRGTGEPDDFEVDATGDATISADATTTELDELVLIDGNTLPYKEAHALKETYLARLRKLEFDIKSGAYVAVEEVGLKVEAEYTILRERLLTLPGKIAFELVNQDAGFIERAIRVELTEALNELSDA